MTQFILNESKWSKDLKKSREDFKDVNNIIELAKFRYDRDLNTPKWLLGIGIAIIFSGSTISSINSLNNIFRPYASLLLVTSAIFILIGLGILIALDNRHKLAMSYLYREKDKQRSKK